MKSLTVAILLASTLPVSAMGYYHVPRCPTGYHRSASGVCRVALPRRPAPKASKDPMCENKMGMSQGPGWAEHYHCWEK